MSSDLRTVLGFSMKKSRHEVAARRQITPPCDPLVLRAEFHNPRCQFGWISRHPSRARPDEVGFLRDEASPPPDRPVGPLDHEPDWWMHRRETGSSKRATSIGGRHIAKRLEAGQHGPNIHDAAAGPSRSPRTMRATLSGNLTFHLSSRSALRGERAISLDRVAPGSKSMRA